MKEIRSYNARDVLTQDYSKMIAEYYRLLARDEADDHADEYFNEVLTTQEVKDGEEGMRIPTKRL